MRPNLWAFFFFFNLSIVDLQCCVSITEPKFVCPTHSEAKQTKTLELGAEKGLLQGQARRIGVLCSKTLNSLMVFREKLLKAKFGVRAAGCVTFFWLAGGEVTGWCSRNLVFTVFSLKLPSSTRVGPLVPTEELKDNIMYIPSGGTRTLPQGCNWLLLLSFCISSLPWLATVWICRLECRKGQGGWMKLIFYRQETGDMDRICTREDP